MRALVFTIAAGVRRLSRSLSPVSRSCMFAETSTCSQVTKVTSPYKSASIGITMAY